MKYSQARATFTFLLLIYTCILTDRTYYPPAVICAIFLHEFGHLTAAKILKVPLIRVILTPFGIRMNFDLSTVNTIKAVTVYLSGSIAGITVGTIVLYFSSVQSKAFFSFALISLTLGIINLLPVLNLDGGCITESLLSARLHPDTAYKITKTVSDVFVFFFWLLTLYVSIIKGVNFSMIALSVYLILSSL